MDNIINYEDLSLTNNFMFCKVMEDMDVCRGVIETLLGIKIERIENFGREKTAQSGFSSKGVRYDVYVRGSNEVFDIEMQVAETEDLPLRARYYQSVADVDGLKPGQTYSDLKYVYIIFLCVFDAFGRNEPMYKFENICCDVPGLKMNDRTCKVFYNIADYKKVQNPDVRELLRYMYKSREANSGLTKQISRSLEYARQNETWRKEFMIMEMQRLVWMKEAQQEGMEKGMQEGMEKGMQEGMAKGLEQGREQGREQGAIEGAHAKAVETARNLIAMGILSPEQTAKATGLSLAQVQQLKQ